LSEEYDIFSILASMFMRCGNKTSAKLADVRRVAASVGIVTYHACIGLHSFIICNAVCVRKGKTLAMNLGTGSTDLLELPTYLERNER
jgi:hypothetical protein